MDAIRLGLLVVFCAVSCWAYQCGEDQLQGCQLSATLEMGRDDSSLSWRDLKDHCKAVRSSLDCVITYSTFCLTDSQRERIRNAIQDARRYLRTSCEYEEKVDENWIDTPCYHGNAMEQCDEEYKRNTEHLSKGGGLDVDKYAACRYYDTYKGCVKKVIQDHCSPAESSFMNTFLLDRAGELAWRCPDDRMDGYLGDQSSIFQGFSGTMKGLECLKKIKQIYDKCTDEFEYKETSARKDISDKGKEQRLCCAFGEYSYCVRKEAEKKCAPENVNLIISLLKKAEEALGRNCDAYYHGSPKCSGSFCSSSFILAVTAALTAVTAWWRH